MANAMKYIFETDEDNYHQGLPKKRTLLRRIIRIISKIQQKFYNWNLEVDYDEQW